MQTFPSVESVGLAPLSHSAPKRPAKRGAHEPVEIFVEESWGPIAFTFNVNNPNPEVPGEISVAFAGGWEESYWERNILELPDYLYTNDWVWHIKLLYTSPAGNRYLLASENFEEESWNRLVLFVLTLYIPELEIDDVGELINFDSGTQTFFIDLPEVLWEEKEVTIGN